MSAYTSSLLDEISRIARQPVLDEELTEKLPNYLQVLGQNFKVPFDESKFKPPVFSKDKEEYPEQIQDDSNAVYSTPGQPTQIGGGPLIVDEETKDLLTGQPRESSQLLGSGATEGTNFPSDDGFDLDF